MIKKLDHIAIAVPNLEQAAAFYEEKLGLKLSHREEVAARGVRVGFIPVGDTRFELVEPLNPDSTIATFLDKRGPGLHHVCLEVDNLAAELKRLAAAGVRLIDTEPKKGAHGNLVAFIHPSATGGVLTELVQPAPKQ